MSAQDDPSVLTDKANELLMAGDTHRAVLMLWKIVGVFPQNARAWDLLSLAYSHMQRYTVAEAAGERAVSLAPEMASARYNTAVALAHSSVPAKQLRAIAHLETVRQLGTGDGSFEYLLGALYEGINQPDKARTVYQQGLHQFPAEPRLRRALAALNGDLNMDGRPPRITNFNRNTVVVDDLGSGAELLRWEEFDKLGPGEAVARTVDLGGSSPSLLVQAYSSASVFAWVGGKPVLLGRVTGQPEYNPVDRSLDVKILVGQRHLATRYQVSGENLVTVATWEEELKPTPPSAMSLSELYAAVAELSSSAMDQSLWQQVVSRFGSITSDDLAFAYLLPEPGGTHRIEVTVNGTRKAVAKAMITENGVFRVGGLEWRN